MKYKDLFDVAFIDDYERFADEVITKAIIEKNEKAQSKRRLNPIYGLSAALLVLAVMAGGAAMLLLDNAGNKIIAPPLSGTIDNNSFSAFAPASVQSELENETEAVVATLPPLNSENPYNIEILENSHDLDVEFNMYGDEKAMFLSMVLKPTGDLTFYRASGKDEELNEKHQALWDKACEINRNNDIRGLCGLITPSESICTLNAGTEPKNGNYHTDWRVLSTRGEAIVGETFTIDFVNVIGYGDNAELVTFKATFTANYELFKSKTFEYNRELTLGTTDHEAQKGIAIDEYGEETEFTAVLRNQAEEPFIIESIIVSNTTITFNIKAENAEDAMFCGQELDRFGVWFDVEGEDDLLYFKVVGGGGVDAREDVSDGTRRQVRFFVNEDFDVKTINSIRLYGEVFELAW
ncbi:MAG: hypothetical protein FWF94_04390 [Oscillospiraceae bacterium]|nr:hypothetical protein [Oscillospiraceae bacterium]